VADEFDRWAANFDDPWVDLEAKDADIKIAVASQDSTFSWESAKRNAALESDGIAAEFSSQIRPRPFFRAQRSRPAIRRPMTSTRPDLPGCRRTTDG